MDKSEFRNEIKKLISNFDLTVDNFTHRARLETQDDRLCIAVPFLDGETVEWYQSSLGEFINSKDATLPPISH